MTETATVVVATSELDIMVGSSGSLLPGCRAKVIDQDGNEVTEYEKRGELYIESPSVVLGYLNNEKATTETFVYHEDGRWIRTGDEVIVTKAPSGHEHFKVVDRIKELIKVKVCSYARGLLPITTSGHADTNAGLPSRSSRARSPPARPPGRGRLRCHPNPRR